MNRFFRFTLVLTALAVATSTASARAQTALGAAAIDPRAPQYMVRVNGRPIAGAPAQVPLLERRVDVQLGGVRLESALKELASQTGVRVVYSSEMADLDRKVSLNVQGLTLAAALTELLFDKDLDVVIAAGNRIVIAPRDGDAAERRAPAGEVRGVVVDSVSREPLLGAQVVVVGTSLGAVTSEDGSYVLPAVPPGRQTIRVRRLGYRTESRTVEVMDGETLSLEFALAHSASTLDEVLVAGSYVETNRRESPVPVTTLSGEEIHRPSRNRIDQLFRGDIPGVVGYDNGASALGLVTYVRGSASLDDSNLLKVYVDGIETPANFLVSGIDMSSIERVELLRGPEASTIYGSNASGGVLLLFTKNGRSGKPQLSGSAAVGITASDHVDGNPLSMEHRLSVSGGGDGFSYSFGGSYDSFGEVIPQADWRQVGAYGRSVLTQGALSVALTAGFSHRILGASNFPAFASLGVPSLVAPRNADFHLSNQILGATFTYAPSQRWQHVLTLGVAGIGLDENNYAARNTFEGDTLRNASTESDRQVTARYVGSANMQLSPNLSSRSTLGVEVTRRTHNYFQAQGLGSPQSGSSAQFDYVEAYKITDDAGVFLQQVFGFGERFFITAGVRAEHNSNVGKGEGLIWAPRAGAAYTLQLGDQLQIKPRASYGQSIRPPQPGQSGAAQNAFQIQRPNPNLRPEVQAGADVGFDLDYRQGLLSFEATYFDQKAKDLIGMSYLSAPAAEVAETQYQNVGRVSNKGVELAVGVDLGRWDLRGSYSTVKSRVESIAADYSGDQQVGDELLYAPRRSGGGTVGFRFDPLLVANEGRSARVEVGLTYIGSRRTLDLLGYYECAFGVSECRGPMRAYNSTLPGFTKLRVGFSHPVSRRSDAFLNVENLTNDQVGEFVTVAPSRGRTILFGVRFGQ
jgi:outer membrane receptor protein involved in Fe transport